MAYSKINIPMEQKTPIGRNEAKSIITNCIAELQKNGYAISEDNFNSISFENINNEIGQFWLCDRKKYNIIINSKLLFKEKLNFLFCAVYHELAHAIQYNEAFDNKIIEYNMQTDEIYAITNNKALAKNTIFDDNGHTLLWLDIIEELNTKFNLTPPITNYLSDAEITKFLEEIFMKEPLRKSSMHIDKTLSGLTMDDIEKYKVKDSIDPKLYEEHKPKRDFRNIEQYGHIQAD